MSTIQGSVAGLTYQGGKFCPLVLRSRINPIKRLSQRSQKQKSAMGAASSVWKIFTSTQRATWLSLAQNYPGSKGKPAPSDSDAGRRLALCSLATIFSHEIQAPTFPTSYNCPPPDFERYRVDFIKAYNPAGNDWYIVYQYSISSPSIVIVDIMGPYAPTCTRQPHGFNSKRQIVTTFGTTLTGSIFIPGLIKLSSYFFKVSVFFRPSNTLIPAGQFYGAFTTNP